MEQERRGTQVEALDILYAVALGEGFLASMYVFKERIIAGDVWSFGPDGQGIARVLIAFLVIVLSWLYYRNTMYQRPRYPAFEFTFDLAILMTYMVLFLLVEAPALFYGMLAVIWLLYAVSNLIAFPGNYALLAYIAAFAGIFGLFSTSVAWSGGPLAEWARICLTVALVALFRYWRFLLFPKDR